jgi:O-antigen ligase
MPLFRSAGGGQRVFLAAAAAFLLVAPFPSSAGWRVFFLLWAGFALAFLARRGQQALELGRVPRAFAIAAGAWIALCLVSLAWSVDPAYTLDEARRELAYGVAVFLVFFIGTRSVAALHLWIATLFFGALLLGLGEWLHMVFPRVWLFRKSSMGPGPLSTHVVILAPLLLVWAWRPPLGMGQRPSVVALGALFLIAAGMAGESRMLWPALLVAAAVAFAVFALQAPPASAARETAKRTFLVALAILPILMIVSTEYKVRYYPKAASAGESLELDERPLIWRLAASQAMRRPWAGHGYGREIVGSEIEKGLAAAGVPKPFGHGHNVFLDTVVQLGAIGIVAFGALIAALAAAFWRLRARGDAMLIALCGLAMLAGYLAKNLTDDFFHRPNSLVFWAVNGMLLGLASRPSAWESPRAAAAPATGTPEPSA